MKKQLYRNEKKDKRTKKERNAFLVLLLRAMYKQEVFIIYNELSILNYSRYYVLERPVNRNYSPKPLTKDEEKKIKVLAYSFVHEMICSVEDMMFSEQKLDDLAKCISLLGKYDSWSDFAAQHNAMSQVTNSYFATDKVLYSQISADEKKRINKDVASALSDKLFDFEYEYMKNEVGFQTGYHRHIKYLTRHDLKALKHFCEAIDRNNYFSHIIEKLKCENTWVSIDRHKQVHGIISFISMTYEEYLTLRIKKVKLKQRQSEAIYHLANIGFDDNQIVNDFEKYFEKILLFQRMKVHSYFSCTYINDFSMFLINLGFTPDDGENEDNGLYISKNLKSHNKNVFTK